MKGEIMKGGVEIAFFGSSLVSAYWNGAATYYRGILGALAERGHQITFYEPDAYGRQEHRDIPDPEWARVVVYSAEGFDGVDAALEDAAQADLVVKASGVGVFDQYLEREVLSLKRPGVGVIFWDVDAPATLERVEGDREDPFRRAIPDYDLVLTYGGGAPVVESYSALGARRTVPIYNALDPNTHFPVEPDPEYEGVLGFLGNRLPDREARVEEFFLGVAEGLPLREFVLGGSGWDERALPSNVRYLGHIYTGAHNHFNSSPLAVLNINRSSMARIGHSPPTRIFEAAGAGACIISDSWPGLEEFLEPGREVLTASSGAEVSAHLEALSASEAGEIGAAARARVLAEHTYDQRALAVEAELDLSLGHLWRGVRV